MKRKGKVVCYFVYANTAFEGETKTLAGARRMAKKILSERDLKGRPFRATIKAAMMDGDRSWLELVEERV